MPSECPVTLYVNGEELLTIQLTPVDLEDWAIGFLFGEGMITGSDDLLKIEIDDLQANVRAEIKESADNRRSGKRYITSGCGKGVTFSSLQDAVLLHPVTPGLAVRREYLVDCMRHMYREAVLYQETGGMHAAMAASLTGPLFVREDIGRHNAVDKVIGACLKAGVNPADIMIMTTGRISYEMIVKVARFGASMVASRTAATDQAVCLATRLGVEVIGYIRGRMLQVYTGGSRIIHAAEAEMPV